MTRDISINLFIPVHTHTRDLTNKTLEGGECGLIYGKRNNEALRYGPPISAELHVMTYTEPPPPPFLVAPSVRT